MIFFFIFKIKINEKATKKKVAVKVTDNLNELEITWRIRLEF